MTTQFESYKSQYEYGIKLIEEHLKAISENVRQLQTNQGRTGHINNIKKSMDTIKIIAESMKKLNYEDEFVTKQALEKVEKILSQAIVLSGIGD